MKFKNLMITLAVALAMVACKDDKGAAKDVAGTYNGVSSYEVMGVSGEVEMSITLVEKSETTVDLTIPAKEYNVTMPNGQERPIMMPDLAIADVTVTGKDGKYTIAEKEFDVVANGMNFTGNLKGTIENNSMVLNYNVTPAGMPGAIAFTFTGTK